VNPHSYLYFDAVGADGAALKMRCEMRAATVLRRSGWAPEMFVPGKHVKVAGNPHRDDPASCYVETLTIGDAPTLERYQQLTTDNSAKPADRPRRPPAEEHGCGRRGRHRRGRGRAEQRLGCAARELHGGRASGCRRAARRGTAR
jgi:hypothetical protein